GAGGGWRGAVVLMGCVGLAHGGVGGGSGVGAMGVGGVGRMGGVSRLWLSERLDKAYPSTAIIIVTGIRDLDPRLTLRPSVVGYLTKPFRPAKVRDMVTKAVGLVNALPPGERIRGTLQPVSDEDIASMGDADEDPDDN